MDAAHTYFNKTVLFLATALLLAVPGRAQTFVLGGINGTNTITGVALGNGYTGVSVASSATPTTEITFTTAITDTSANPTGRTWLGITGVLTTPTTLYFNVANSSGMVAGQTYTATVTLTSTAPSAGIQGTIGVSFLFGSSSSGGILTASTTSVALSAASGGIASAQVTLTNNSANTVTFSILPPTTTTGGSWLTATANISQVTSGGSAILTIAVPNGLTLANGTYYGAVNLSPSGTVPQISVTFTVGTGVGNGYLTAYPNPLSWSYTTGSGVYPSSQLITLTSAIGATTYSDNVSGASPWLYANSAYSSSGYPISSGITISPNPLYLNSLGTGSYTGSVLVWDVNNNQVTITVNLSVNGGSTGAISWSPNPVTITAALSGYTQQVTVSLTSATPGTFSVTNIIGSGLSVGGFTISSYSPAAASVIVYGNPTGLSASTYAGDLYVSLAPTAGGSAISQTIPISFVVGSGGTITTSGLVIPTSLSFAYQTSTAVTPPTQSIVVSGTGTFTVGTPTYPAGQAGGNWLSVTPASSGTAPSTISVSIPNPGTLQAGTYTATVVVTPASAAATTVTISLLVTASPVLYTNPGSLNFTLNAGVGLTSSPVYMNASDYSAIPVSATTTATWLTVTSPQPPSTGSVMTVSVTNPLLMANGVYAASVTVTATGAANSPVNIPVVLTVTGSSATGGGNLTLGSLSTFYATQGGSAPASQTLSVSASTTTYYSASATTTSTSNWLSISSLSGYTNSSLTVSVSPSGLTANTYYGTITLLANGITQTVQVSLVVSSSSSSGNVTVTPASLSFAYTAGGTAPLPQTLSVTSPSGQAGIYFTVASSATWLAAGVTNGTTPVNGLTISIVNPSSLAAGPYSATITITPTGGAQVTVQVTLTVTAAPTVTATSTPLSFTYQAGGANPSTQTVNVSGGGASLGFSATVTLGSNWLSVSPTSGTTPTTGTTPVTVTATPGTLGANTYTGSILVSGTGTAGGSTTISVTLTITAPLPTIISVKNAASGAVGAVSPGEIVSIYGTNLGPATAAYATVDPTTGKLATTVGGVQVLFNGIPAPVFYAGATQVNAVVPYEMAPIASPSVWIKYVGQTSNAYQLSSATTAPGLFTQNSSGSGPGSILNQDGITTNGPGNPAAKGSIVTVYLTGEGQTSPQGVTGKITTVSATPPLTPAPLLPIGVLINGLPALPVFAGEAPGFAAGLMQLNVQIPLTAQSGNLSITVSIGSNISQSGVTVSVQ